MRKKFWRNLLIIVLISLPLGILAIDYWVTRSTQAQLYTDVQQIPYRKVGLVLGTGKYLGNGQENLFYRYRIEAAVALYKAGKVSFLLVSGDNSRKDYSEPEMMKTDLIAAGVPAEKIFLDFAGFRTLDSIVRCREVFGEDNITIISQAFHNQRALFLANHKEVDAVAYNARDVQGEAGLKVAFREKLARVKLLLDLVFNKQPKFYGEKITIR